MNTTPDQTTTTTTTTSPAEVDKYFNFYHHKSNSFGDPQEVKYFHSQEEEPLGMALERELARQDDDKCPSNRNSAHKLLNNNDSSLLKPFCGADSLFDDLNNGMLYAFPEENLPCSISG
eukprot:CAMPEP_0115022192 /NCGR_PEP_ID=MMETSP0216-20121206/31376_1 /TAXON_ID=223996 /ORGANISM="Protocruzia adherens, Strain Boccale" /LENGTH=118 /DNA_ID=CAMNT_0002394773 /DNA_START=466 /DNA_END=822 /DNA_ORIENTATION=-